MRASQKPNTKRLKKNIAKKRETIDLIKGPLFLRCAIKKKVLYGLVFNIGITTLSDVLVFKVCSESQWGAVNRGYESVKSRVRLSVQATVAWHG